MVKIEKLNCFERVQKYRINVEEQTIRNIAHGTSTRYDLEENDEWDRIRKEIFESVQDLGNWKNPTKPKVLKTWGEADLLADILTFYCGGSEVRPITENFEVVGYEVKSKGYYHYIGI